MSGPMQPFAWFRSLRVWTAILAAGWTGVVCVLSVWSHRQIDEQAARLAVVDARASFLRDVAFCRWSARHGGVYAPVGEGTLPNPNLAHVPDRDIALPSGRTLTLLNSAYMSRQIHDWFTSAGDPVGRVVSLRPLDPANTPDAWEARALAAFEAGEAEVTELCQADEQRRMRLIRPLIAEQSCLKCHGSQGYEEGDIRGGLSISVPMDNYEHAAMLSRAHADGTYLILWLLGMGVIGGASLLVRRRARAEQAAGLALLESEQKFRAIFNQSFHLAGVLTPEGRVVDINGFALKFAGIELGDVLDRLFWETPWWNHDPAIQVKLRDAITAAAVRGVAARFEAVHLDRHGESRNIDFVLRPIKNDASEALFLVAEGRDITEQKRAEEERLRLTEQLLHAQKLESIGRLAAGVAHDFNNLLAPVMGYADILLAGKPEEHPDREALQSIMDSVVRARALTNQLLTCAQRQPIEKRAMDLNATIAGFHRLLRGTLRENIAIEVQLQPDLAPIHGDAGQIEQILLNLALNAQDAMPEGGRWKVETRQVSVEERCDHLAGDAPMPGEYALLRVGDTGMGMDPATAERAFEPFFTTKPPDRGTGLGLATVYGIVKQHAGHIELHTAPGAGTTFDLYFPLPAAPALPLGPIH